MLIIKDQTQLFLIHVEFLLQAGLISHQSLPNLLNEDISNFDPPSFQNNYDINAQNSWQQYDQQYTQNEPQVWQSEQVTQSEYQQQENQHGFQKSGEVT